MIRAVLLDLDGVIRHFDVAPLAEIERRHGLAPRTILEALLDPTRLEAATTGRITDEAWRSAAADVLGAAGSDFLAWNGLAGHVDAEVVALIGRLSVPVGLLTNATSRLPSDLRALGLHETFDAVVNTSDLGFAKPDPRAFERAASLLGFSTSEILFVDDTLRNVEAAASLGFVAHRFASSETLARLLKENGLLSALSAASARRAIP